MIGVVVWSSAVREKAVIWCEDHAALAYLQGRNDVVSSAVWPEPGDLVELDSETQGNLRCARKVTLLSERHCPELPHALRKGSQISGQPAPARAEPHLRLVSGNGEPAAQQGNDSDCHYHRCVGAGY